MDLVGARSRDQIGGGVQRFESPSVRPPPVEDAVGECAVFQIRIVNVRDFEFTSTGGPEFTDAGEYGTVIKVNPYNCKMRRRVDRLLRNGDNPAILEFGHAKPFGIAHLLEQDMSPLRL